MLSKVIGEVAAYGHANVSDPYGGPYLARINVIGDKIRMIRMANHKDVMLVECETWEDMAWHFQTEPTIYPCTRPFPFYVGEKL